jgi:putative ligand-binding protein with streptavidin-like fold
MRTFCGPRVDATIFGMATLLALALGGRDDSPETTERFQTEPAPAVAVTNGATAYVGVWLTVDDQVRLDVSADGTYERSIVGRKQSARGLYRVAGSSLLLVDESGIRTTVTSVNGGLEMAGYHLEKDLIG